MIRPGLYFALLQLFFTLSWTVYVIFLPRLAVEAGLPRTAIVWILLADQVVFLLTDWCMGLGADRMARVLGRLGLFAALLSLVSALAFLALPLVAPAGNPAWFLAVTLVWTITSSALRAPPLMLIGKHVRPSGVPLIASLWLLGMGLAGAASPYLTLVLRDLDPRLPFALAAISVALAAWGLVWAEKRIAIQPATPGDAPVLSPPVPALRGLPVFLAACACAAFAFQVHFSINSVPGYLRLAGPADLEKLMPVFWIGFNLCVLPVANTLRNRGELSVLTFGAMAAAIAVFAASQAVTLDAYLAAQFAAGAGWAAVMLAMFGAALGFGRTGREGLASGSLFSTLALAAALRIGIALMPLNADQRLRHLLDWLPPLAFLAAAILFSVALTQGRNRRPAAA